MLALDAKGSSPIKQQNLQHGMAYVGETNKSLLGVFTFLFLFIKILQRRFILFYFGSTLVEHIGKVLLK